MVKYTKDELVDPRYEIGEYTYGVPTVIDICPGTCSGGAGGIAKVGSGVCFRSLGTGGTGAELWCSDGTPGGTAKVKEIGPGSTPGYIALIVQSRYLLMILNR